MNFVEKAKEYVSLVALKAQEAIQNISDDAVIGQDWNHFDTLQIPQEINKDMSIHLKLRYVEKKKTNDNEKKVENS